MYRDITASRETDSATPLTKATFQHGKSMQGKHVTGPSLEEAESEEIWVFSPKLWPGVTPVIFFCLALLA